MFYIYVSMILDVVQKYNLTLQDNKCLNLHLKILIKPKKIYINWDAFDRYISNPVI